MVKKPNSRKLLPIPSENIEPFKALAKDLKKQPDTDDIKVVLNNYFSDPKYKQGYFDFLAHVFLPRMRQVKYEILQTHQDIINSTALSKEEKKQKTRFIKRLLTLKSRPS